MSVSLTYAQIAPLIGTASTCLLLLGWFLVFLIIVRPKKKALDLQESSTFVEKTAAHLLKFKKAFEWIAVISIILGIAGISFYFGMARPTTNETIQIRRINIDQKDDGWLTWIEKRHVEDKEGNDDIPGVNVKFKRLENPDEEIAYDESADGITFVRVESPEDEAAFIIAKATQTNFSDGSAKIISPNTAPMHYSEYEIVAYITEDTLEKSGISTDVMVDSYELPEVSMYIDEVNNKKTTYITPHEIEF